MSSLLEKPSYIADLDCALDHTLQLDKLQSSRVLITGASGLIGSFLVDMLMHAQERDVEVEVIAVGRSLERLEQRFGTQFANSKLHLVEHDASTSWESLPPADYAIHAASGADPAAFREDPVGIMRANIDGVYHALEYARKHGTKRVTYISSGEVYGEFPEVVDELTEDMAGQGSFDLLSSRSCYPVAKRAAETLCASYSAQHAVDFVVVRPPHTYGPSAQGTDTRANAQFVAEALAGKDLHMKSSGAQVRSYTYIADGASAILSAMLAGQAGEAYNYANPACKVSIAELAQEIARQTGVKLIFDSEGTNDNPASPISRQVLSAAKLEALGWSAAYSLEDGIAATFAAMKD